MFRTILTATVAVAASVLTAGAQQRIDDVERCAPPPPCPNDARCARPMVMSCRPMVAMVQRTSGRVRAELAGRVVRYEVEETYVNRGGVVGEADYVLPLPKGAAFEDLAISINGEMVSGETMRAERARAVYEEIVRKLRDPALVEWMGHDMLRTRIFPIQPGEEKRVVVKFRAVAEREGDALRIDWLGSRRSGDNQGSDSFELRYGERTDGDVLGDAYSPTHQLRTDSRGEGGRVVRAEGGHGPLTVLVPVRSRNTAAISLLAHAPRGEDGYALITLSPPFRAVRESARDVTFVIDISGSMSGRKMEQARAAGRQLLESLSPSDRFRVIAFSTDVREFRDGWAPATSENVRRAREYLDGLQATGGTNIMGALQEALSANSSEGRFSVVLFLTDGAPTVGETRPEMIASRASELRRDRRVFTFGMGADVNASLLEQLALQGRGTATFVRPEESVERAVGVVAQRLTRPVATDVRLHLDGARLYGMQPEGAIDLFAGQDLVVLARYSGARENATLSIDGRGPDGAVHWDGRVTLPQHETENGFVARLWAVQRVGYLSAERRRAGGNAELDGELRQLGERFGIPTELTSYLVTEPGMKVNAVDANGQRQLGAVVPTAAPASAMGAGGGLADDQRRFEKAKESALQRAAKSVAEVDEIGRRDGATNVRSAGTHSFRQVDGVWKDTRPVSNLRVVKVKAYSAAYFDLVKRMPELAQLFAVGDKVRVHGRAVAIEVSDDGVSQLDAAALDAVVREW